MEITYKVYQIAQLTGVTVMRPDHLSPYLLFDTQKQFEEEYQAVDWIEHEGERGMNYTVLQIIKRKSPYARQ